MADLHPESPSPVVLPERYSAPTPIAPDADTWRAMTPAQREATINAINEAMPFEELMSEGMPHSTAKMEVVSRLRRFFRHHNRGILVAPELTVLYPGEHSFVPDVIAVCDVELRDRNAWVVMDEGRGPDFVLEIRNLGRRAKDYRRNVECFARLGIPEYFVYECVSHELAGYHLEDPGARRYVPIVPQAGRYPSRSLELDLAVVDKALRFFYAGAEISDADAELQWMGRIVADREARLEEVSRLAAAEAERARTEAERALEALAALRGAVRSVLTARGLSLDAAASARLDAESDPHRLRELVARAAGTATAETLFAD